MRPMRRVDRRSFLAETAGTLAVSWSGAAAVSSLSCRATVQGQVRRLARKNPQVLYHIDTDAKAVALTIDDGPDPATTPEILDVLSRNEARATFFIISSRVPGNEASLRRMVAEDHELGNHMPRDEPSIKLSPEEFERQLLESDEVLSAFAPVCWFRPGSGKYNPHMLATLERYGYRCPCASEACASSRSPSSKAWGQ